jgi:hypothetical protein
MWNSGYWQCPYKSHPSHCMDGDTDDVGFLEAVTQALQDRLPSKPTDVSALTLMLLQLHWHDEALKPDQALGFC